MNTPSTEYEETVEIVAGVARLLHQAACPRGHRFIDIHLALGASLASQHALWLLPEDVDAAAGPMPVASDPVELIRAAESLLRQLPDGADALVAGLPGLIADVCGLVRDCRAA
ncbi:hypothetical protein BH23ACT6_BH23ACT6_24980 [soil metagenome]